MIDSDDSPSQRLGEYLRQRRQEAALTVAELCHKTRIAPAMLRAMESGDYRALPAHAFARGFYAIYAKALGLNDERIVNWYGQERQEAGDVADGYTGGSAIYEAVKTHRMASAGPPRPLVTLLILIAFLLVMIAVFCWHFEVNPVTVIREKIHLVQERSLSHPQYFRIPNTSKVIHRANEKKKAPLVTLNEAG
jgi:cytoskeletal protein RodZ